MRHLALAATVALAALVTAPALAAEIALTAKVEAVTVFPDGAMVTREGQAALPAGEHVLLLKGLPAGVDPASVRIEAKADVPLVIGTVESRAAPAAQPSGEAAASSRICGRSSRMRRAH